MLFSWLFCVCRALWERPSPCPYIIPTFSNRHMLMCLKPKLRKFSTNSLWPLFVTSGLLLASKVLLTWVWKDIQTYKHTHTFRKTISVKPGMCLV